MKDFLKKLFFTDRPAQGISAKLSFSWGKSFSTDSPAQGAFAGTTLLLVSLWLAPALFLLCGGPMDFSRWEKWTFPWQMVFFLPIPCLLLYVLTAWFHFYRERAGNKKTALFTGAFLLFSFFYLFFGGPLPGLAIPILPVILAPVILIPRVWKFALARGFCLLGAAGILGTRRPRNPAPPRSTSRWRIVPRSRGSLQPRPRERRRRKSPSRGPRQACGR